ncbi:MAG: hypothetical protein LBG65_06715 [Puniceicoccales bacterium]|jgi:hypothetical protein|nr:hypothetical protein [Puniceicoccales bacterium]
MEPIKKERQIEDLLNNEVAGFGKSSAPQPHAPAKTPWKSSDIALITFFVCLIALIIFFAWEYGETLSTRAPVPARLSSFKSSEPFLTETWFKQNILAPKGSAPLTSGQVLEKLYKLEQIKHASFTPQLDGNDIKFSVWERTPAFRYVQKGSNGPIMRFVDNEGVIYSAINYPSTLRRQLPEIRDIPESEITLPEENEDKKTSPNPHPQTSAHTAKKDDAPSPPTPMALSAIRGGATLAMFAKIAAQTLGDEMQKWLCISARDYRALPPAIGTESASAPTFYQVKRPPVYIRVILDPQRQPFPMPAGTRLRQLVFSAEPERFARELREYAKSGVRQWITTKMTQESAQFSQFDLCMYEEKTSPGTNQSQRVVLLRPVIDSRKTEFPDPNHP